MSGVRGLTVAYYGSSYIQVNDSSKTGGVLPSGIFTEYVYGVVTNTFMKKKFK